MANVTRILAVSLIVLAVLLGIFAWSLSRRAPVPAPQVVQGQASLPVVVATRDLPAGKPIDANALSLRMAPSRGADEFADAAGLVGRVPLVAIAANTPLSEASLTTGLADAIAPGERAIAVRVDESNAVGNRVRPGNFVDVFFMLKRDMSAGPGTNAEVDATQARLLLSRVRVLSFGDAALPGTSDAADAAANAANAPRSGGAHGGAGRARGGYRRTHACRRRGPPRAGAAQSRRYGHSRTACHGAASGIDKDAESWRVTCRGGLVAGGAGGCRRRAAGAHAGHAAVTWRAFNACGAHAARPGSVE